MTLPVSSYEELLARVRSLTSETIQLRREITSSLCDPPVPESASLPSNINYGHHIKTHSTILQERTSANEDLNTVITSDLRTTGGKSVRAPLFFDKKEDEIDNEFKEIDEKLTSPDNPAEKISFNRNGWAFDTLGLWHSGPSSLNLGQTSNNYAPRQDLTTSYNSYEPQSHSFSSSSKRAYSHQQLGAKVEMVYSLLSMLDMDNREDMSKTFLAMSSSPESCHAMRQSGCLPLLIQLIHSFELNKEVRNRAAEALSNIVHAQIDEKRRRREVRVLKLLQQVREYCDELKNTNPQEILQLQESEKHPINAIGTLMKFSFDAEHRQAICTLGGLHAISELIQVDHEIHGSTNDDTLCITLRRYAGMSLTNLTFGDGKNKSLLCSFNKFMRALVDQLKSPSEDLRQVTASVLRNLSWRADSESKESLRSVGAVTALTVSAMEGKKESTLKSILSALWNLSAHCSLNKIDICSVPGALTFLVKMLRYKSSSNTLAIVENAGGILRNISSHIAVREDYRQILRNNNCFEVLLEQLKSPSLTIVSNACGTLWNLSARCPEDQRRLWEMGATSMLRSLVQSKHKMISMGSSAALKNLLAANPNENLLTHLDSTAKSLGLQSLPTLFVRKKRALEQELNITLAETCDNIDPIGSPTHFNSPHNKMDEKKTCGPRRSESHDSVQSTQSDSTYERINQITHKNEEKLFENKNITLHDSLDEKSISRKVEDQKLMRRYKTSMIPTPTFKKVDQDRICERNREETGVEDHVVETVVETDFKGKTNLDLKEGNKKGKPLLKTRIKNNVTHNSDSCSFSSNHLSQSNEKSLYKNEENELFETKVVEKYHKTSNAVSNSQVDEEFMASNLVYEENNSKKPNRRIESNKVIESWDENETQKKTNEERRNLNNSKGCISSVNSLAVLSKELPCTDKNFKEFAKNVKEDVYNKTVTENSFEDKIFCSSNSSKAQVEITQRVLNNESFDGNSSVAATDKMLNVEYQEQNPNIKLPVMNPMSKDFESKDCKLNISNELLPAENLEFGTSFKFLQENVEVSKSDDSVKLKEGQCNFLCKNTEQNGRTQLNEILPFNTKTFTREIRKEAGGKPSHALLASSSNLPQQSCPNAELNLKDQADYHSQMVDGVIVSTQADTEKADILSSYSSVGGNHHLQAEDPSSLLKPKQTEGFSEMAMNAEDELDKRDNIYPKFKVGSPITDSRVLQMEVNKICREIKKQQDFEMGCSLTSEVSLISCSSFLDTGDYSLFDSSTDLVDFDESENMLLSKASSKIKSFHLRKPTTSQTVESMSLPSLGSLKNEQLEALDLDNSVLSVASITSEIAETYSKDLEGFNTYTKTCKADAQNDFMDETAADVTLVSNGDDTLNADSLQNNAEFFDEDNSLHCQENLPLDSEMLQEVTPEKVKNKLTPKERRKTFHERYRTYTIRDFQGCKNSEVKSVISGEDAEVNLTKGSESPISYAQRSSQLQDIDFIKCNLSSKNDHAEENKNEKRPNFYSENKYETFHFSKSLDRERNFIPDLASDSKSLNDLLSIGPAERKELVDNAKLVAFSLKSAVQDPEIISDSEIEEPPKSLDIDTATYSKNLRHRCLDDFRPQELQSWEHYHESEDLDKKGAKILKPGDKSDEKLEEISKGIRGRRKPLYSQKNSLKIGDSPLNLSKVSQTMTETKKLLSGTCRSPILNREGTFTKEDASDSKKVEVKNARGIPVLNRNSEPKNLNSLRAGTKNKTGIPVGNSKRLGEIQVSRIGRPLSTYASKSNEKRAESDSSQRRPFSVGSSNRTGGDNATTAKRSASTGLVSPKMKNSSSNQNIRAGNSSGSGSLAKSKHHFLQSSKSQSDASLNLASKDKVSTGKQKTPKKEVTSKIASLWRKVEETKQKNKNVKDNRVWIGPDKSLKTADEVLVIEQEEILDIPSRKIVHSFTCQALGDETSHFDCHERDSRNFVERSNDRADKSERRNIISAVVPPYNYNPPASEQGTPPKIKEMEVFHKGSLKVTTV